MILYLLLWGIGLGLLVVNIGLCVRQMQSPLAFAHWRQAWRWRIVGDSCGLVMGARILWLVLDDAQSGKALTVANYLVAAMASGMALSFFMAHWFMRRIFQVPLAIATSVPAEIHLTADGIITRWNTAAVRMFGWTTEEALGQELAGLIIPARLQAAHRAGLARWRTTTTPPPWLSKQFQVYALHRDGTELLVQVDITPVRDEGSTQIVFHSVVHRLLSI